MPFELEFFFLVPEEGLDGVFDHNMRLWFELYIYWMLVGWVLWHINVCRLFNAKSIFMKIVVFQTIYFSISTQFKCKYNLIVKNISISSYSV